MTRMTNNSKKSAPIRLLTLAGDGIGPEIMQATLVVLQAVTRRFDLSIDYCAHTIGLEALAQYGTTLPPAVLEQITGVDGIILGPVSHNQYPPLAQGGLNPSGELRKRLHLYANIRPAKARPGLGHAFAKDMDLVIVRENTEGFYADRSMFAGPGEIMPSPDLALSLRKVTRQASMDIAAAAFELARSRRRHVTAVHKANVLRTSDGLFLECVRSVAQRYPDVFYQERLVDAMAALLIRNPAEFDVIVTTNMFGDILSDEASELAGSLGLAPSLNIGREIALAQAQHGSAPDIAKQNIANPCSLIGSVAMLLAWLGQRRNDPKLSAAATTIEQAIDTILATPDGRTRDLGGTQSTDRLAAQIAQACVIG